MVLGVLFCSERRYAGAYFLFCEVHKHRESHQDDNHPQGRFRYKFAYGMIFGGVHAVKVLIFANIVKIKKLNFILCVNISYPW